MCIRDSLYPVHAAEQAPAAVLKFLVGDRAGAQVCKFLQNGLLCAGGIGVLHTEMCIRDSTDTTPSVGTRVVKW